MTKEPHGSSDDTGIQLLVYYNSECCIKVSSLYLYYTKTSRLIKYLVVV